MKKTMTDIVTKEKRSQMMAGIKSKNTKPEMLVRKALHKQGYRYKIHDKSLLGRPDLVFPKYRTAIFINGCFWHGHHCHLFRIPKTKTSFWEEKIAKNKERDYVSKTELLANDWKILIITECSLKGKTKRNFSELIDDIVVFLHNTVSFKEITGK